MKEILLRPNEPKLYPQDVFFCPEESQFYSHCLELLVLRRCDRAERIVEFGCGDGSPVIHALLRSRFEGVVRGYELNASASEVAQTKIEQYSLTHRYVVHRHSFFEATPRAEYLVANPPYLPAPDDKILMPLLHGGADGAALTRRLLSLGYGSAMLMISSYANPVDTIDHAIAQGYTVADFIVSPLKFGYYSSEPKVEDSILELRNNGKAFYSDNIYFLAGVLFKQRHESPVDLSAELLQVLTAL